MHKKKGGGGGQKKKKNYCFISAAFVSVPDCLVD